MSTNPIGHVLILNNEKFYKKGRLNFIESMARDESETDAKRLGDTFRNRGFKVEERKDKTAQVFYIIHIVNNGTYIVRG